MNFNKIFRLNVFMISTLLLLHKGIAVEILRPRGVSISRASLYSADDDFTCFDGSLTVPFTYINDDYCDCEDGSDEPGTPACPNGTFHCTNAGHRPMDIPSSRVNDGICDCCDGSDEYGGVEKRGGGTCSNTCLEMGRAAREEAQRLAELQRQGSELRRELANKGKEMQKERSEKLTQLRKDREEAEALKAEREAIKNLAEERENGALAVYREAEEQERLKREEQEKAEQTEEARTMFNTLDSDQNGRVSVAEVRVRQTFDQNKDGEVSDDEARFFLGQSEEVSEEEFVRDCWPRMKPIYMMESGMFVPPERGDQPPEEEEGGERPEGEGVGEVEDITAQMEEQDQEEDEQEDEEDEENYAPDSESDDGHANSTDDGRQHEGVQYDEETQRLIDEATQARLDYEEADRAVRDIQRDVRQHEEALEKDYGLEQEFAPLDGECFEYTDREYIYKLCPFDQATQRPKSGGTETRLGQWGQWAGLSEDKYSSMIYDRGQACWNGPQRSTLVIIFCGIENQLVAVSEPNRCEYRFDFVSPAACKQPESATEGHSHDEL